MIVQIRSPLLGIGNVAGHWDTWLAHAAVIVVVKVIQARFLHSLLSHLIQVGTIVLKRIKVLCDTRDQMLETIVTLGASSGSNRDTFVVSHRNHQQ